MYSLFCTLYYVIFILFTFLGNLYSVHFIMYSIFCTLYYVIFILYILLCTLYSVHFILKTLLCTHSNSKILFCVARVFLGDLKLAPSPTLELLRLAVDVGLGWEEAR